MVSKNFKGKKWMKDKFGIFYKDFNIETPKKFQNVKYFLAVLRSFNDIKWMKDIFGIFNIFNKYSTYLTYLTSIFLQELASKFHNINNFWVASFIFYISSFKFWMASFTFLGWLAHLVSRFACNTRVIVDASSNPPVSHLKLL